MPSRLLTLMAVLLVGAGDSAARVTYPALPRTIAFWTEAHGLAGFDASRACTTGQFCRSQIRATTDGGRSWNVVWTGGLPVSISVVPGTDDAWAVVQSFRPCRCQPRLLQTTDGGRTWRVRGKGLWNPSFPTSQTGFAFRLRVRSGELGPLLRTTNGGTSWVRTASPCRQALSASASFGSPAFGRVLCGSQPGAGNQAKAIYETSDGGLHWSLLASAGMGRAGSGLCTCGYAGDIAFSGEFGLLVEHRSYSYRSIDGGRHWRHLGVTSPEVVEGDDAALVSGTTGYLLRGKFGRYEDLLRTTNGGRTWRVIRRWSARP